MRLTKAGLIHDLSLVANLTMQESETVVDAVLEAITEALAKGDKIVLRGFGSFRVRHRNPRRGRNPKTGTPVSVPSKRVPAFKMGKELWARLNAPAPKAQQGAGHE